MESNRTNSNYIFRHKIHIMPIPQASANRSKRNYKRGKTTILTATPNVEEFKEHVISSQSKSKKEGNRKIFSVTNNNKKPLKKPKLKVVEQRSSDSSVHEDLRDDSLSSWSDEVDEVSKPLQQSLLIDQVECEDINEGDFQRNFKKVCSQSSDYYRCN
jgi:hypothetical protein